MEDSSRKKEIMLAWLTELLSTILKEHPDGISEHQLIRRLGEYGVGEFQRNLTDNLLSLFQCHFLLFHCLYRLRDQLIIQKIGNLLIHCQKIQWQPYVASDGQSLTQPDGLREYYLDLSQLQSTTEQGVAHLLEQFWERFYSLDRRSEALETLGLGHDADFSAIKYRYRQLAREHHPDLGGDTAKLQQINAAMAVLEKCY